MSVKNWWLRTRINRYKTRLYFELSNRSSNELSDSELELWYLLAQDLGITQKKKVNTIDKKNNCK